MSEKSSLKHMVHFEKSGFIAGGRIICTEKDNESCSVLHNISINIKSLRNNMQNFEISWQLMKEMGTKVLSQGPAELSTTTQNSSQQGGRFRSIHNKYSIPFEGFQ